MENLLGLLIPRILLAGYKLKNKILPGDYFWDNKSINTQCQLSMSHLLSFVIFWCRVALSSLWTGIVIVHNPFIARSARDIYLMN